MKGVIVLGDHRVEVQELEKPVPGHGQVVVRAIEVGVCGSDLHGYRREGRGDGQRFVSGHELTGVVDSIGPGVEHLRPGDRVMAYQAWGCGYCKYCASGRSNLCTNRKVIGKAHRYQKEYSVMPEAVALPVPDELTLDDAVMLSCAGGTAWTGLQKARPSVDDATVVFGLGPVGLMAVFWARAMGSFVIGVEVNPIRLALGKDAGAHVVINPGECDPVERVRELTLGEGARVGFEASGNKGAQEMLLGATHFEGRIVYAAIAPPGKVIDPSGRRQGAFLGNRAVHGTFTFSMGAYFDMVRALLLHDLHPGKLITHRFSIDDAEEAYRVTDSGDCGKVIFQWDE